MLLYLLADFARDINRLRDRFSADPAAVLDDYNVAVADYQALLALPNAILTLLPEAVLGVIRAIRNVPTPMLLWPGPTLRLGNVQPDLVQVGQAVSFQIDVDIAPADTYDGTPFTATVLFKRDGTVVAATPVTVTTPLEGPLRRVSCQCQATFDEPGAYQAEISIVYGGDLPYTKTAVLDNAVQVRPA